MLLFVLIISSEKPLFTQWCPYKPNLGIDKVKYLYAKVYIRLIHGDLFGRHPDCSGQMISLEITFPPMCTTCTIFTVPLGTISLY